MFNNCDSKTNGEEKFFNDIKDNINVIFDVGCRSNSVFTNFKGDVHYFDPVEKFVENLKKFNNLNQKSYFNNFGLGYENGNFYYYPKFQSFYNRIKSCRVNDDSNKVLLNIKKGKDYMIEQNINSIDFLKIDTEGSEFDVIKGFEDFIDRVQIIQFEYGGTFLDNNVKLNDIVQYLKDKGFSKFAYLTNNQPVIITNFNDHYKYCNIVCLNQNIHFTPY